MYKRQVLGILLVIAVGMLLFTRRPDKQLGRALKEEGALLRSETGRALAENRQEIAAAIRGMNDSTVHALSEITRTNDAAFARPVSYTHLGHGLDRDSGLRHGQPQCAGWLRH